MPLGCSWAPSTASLPSGEPNLLLHEVTYRRGLPSSPLIFTCSLLQAMSMHSEQWRSTRLTWLFTRAGSMCRLKRFAVSAFMIIATVRGFLLNFGVYSATRAALGLSFKWSPAIL